MKYGLCVLAVLYSVTAHAQDWLADMPLIHAMDQRAVEPVTPSKIRILASTDQTITLDFSAKGDTAEVEQFRGGKWMTLTPAVTVPLTNPKPNGCFEITTPIRKGSANQTRVCAIGNGKRLCSSEGVYAQR